MVRTWATTSAPDRAVAVDEAAEPDAEAEAEPAAPELLVEVVPFKLFRLVTVAVIPVAFTQVGPAVVLLPATKLTAAHYDRNRVSICPNPNQRGLYVPDTVHRQPRSE